YWRVSGSDIFEENAMNYTSDDNWTTHLTVPSDAEQIEYYIWAEANSGKTITRPIVAPDGYWTFDVSSLSAQEWANRNIVGTYPHPASDELYVNFHDMTAHVTLTAYCLFMQTRYENTWNFSNGKSSLKLDSSRKGTLLLTFSGSFAKVHRKVVKM